MSRPSDSARADCVEQWAWYGFETDSCPFEKKLTHELTQYDSDKSLICSARFSSLSHSYKVYFSVSPTHQLITRYLSEVTFLPLFKIDLKDLKTVNCRGDKCRRSFGPESGIWCTACHGEPRESASGLISCLLKSSFKFNEIPESCILHIEARAKDRAERYAQEALRASIESLKEMIGPGGEYDQQIEAIEKKRAADAEFLAKLERELEDS